MTSCVIECAGKKKVVEFDGNIDVAWFDPRAKNDECAAMFHASPQATVDMLRKALDEVLAGKGVFSLTLTPDENGVVTSFMNRIDTSEGFKFASTFRNNVVFGLPPGEARARHFA